MNYIRRQHSTCNNYNKSQWLSIVSHIPEKSLRKIGFSFSHNSYASARRHAKAYGHGMPRPAPSQPPRKQSLSAAAVESISSFLHEHSTPAANRTVKYYGIPTPVRYLDQNKRSPYQRRRFESILHDITKRRLKCPIYAIRAYKARYGKRN